MSVFTDADFTAMVLSQDESLFLANDKHDERGRFARREETEDEHQEKAERYFGLGHGDEGSFRVWALIGDEIKASPVYADESEGQTHGSLWGHDTCDRSFKGRYEPESGRISVVAPESWRQHKDDKEIEDYVHHILVPRLRKKLGDIDDVLIFSLAMSGGNPNHDELGRFASVAKLAPDTGGSVGPGASGMTDAEARKLIGSKGFKIHDIVDTRDYEIVVGSDGEEHAKPIAGSGDSRPCDRCGKSHEVHVMVKCNATGKDLIVGSGCAKAWGVLDDKTSKNVVGLVSGIKKLERERAKLVEQRERRAAAEKEVATFALPPITRDDKKGSSPNARAIPTWHMGDQMQVQWDGEQMREYTSRMLADSWRSARATELCGVTGSAMHGIHVRIHDIDKQLVKKRSQWAAIVTQPAVEASLSVPFELSNPNHDEHGRFAAGAGAAKTAPNSEPTGKPGQITNSSPERTERPKTDASGAVKGSGKAPDSPEFKKWFGKSAVVDGQGNPLVVYHGTRGDFNSFDSQLAGKGPHSMGDPGITGRGFYFTDSAGLAGQYPHERGDGQSVMPVYLKLEKPYDGNKDSLHVLDRGMNPDEVRRKIQAAGHDGVVRRYPDGETTEFVAFKPEQIKSATGNKGTFDGKSKDIRLSNAHHDEKGRFAVKSEGARTIDAGLLQKFDGSRLTSEQRAQAVESTRFVLENMPEAARRLLQDDNHLTQAVYFPNTAAIGAYCAERFPDVKQHIEQDPQWRPAAYYDEVTGFAALRLDAGGQAHELSHALDGKGLPTSQSAEWQSAWKEELSGRQSISRYASVSPAEGFAEMGRSLYAPMLDSFSERNGHSLESQWREQLDELQTRFPKSWGVFERLQLLPKVHTLRLGHTGVTLSLDVPLVLDGWEDTRTSAGPVDPRVRKNANRGRRDLDDIHENARKSMLTKLRKASVEVSKSHRNERGIKKITKDAVRELRSTLADSMMQAYFKGHQKIAEKTGVQAALTPKQTNLLHRRMLVRAKEMMDAAHGTIRKRIDKNFEEIAEAGHTPHKGAKLMKDAFRKAGMHPDNDYQVKSLLSTGLRAGYAAGVRDAANLDDSETWGFQRVATGPDPCNVCELLDGTTANKHHEIWDDMETPSHDQCMCVLIPLSEPEEEQLPPDDVLDDAGEDVTGTEPFERSSKGLGALSLMVPIELSNDNHDELGRFATSGGVARVETPAFKKWFDGSKVVDEQGNPLICHHGGAAGVSVFDPEKAGSVRYADWGKGVYFTPSKWMADGYRSDFAANTDAESSRLWDEYEAAAKRLGTRPMYESIDLGYGSPKYQELKVFSDRWAVRREAARKEADAGKIGDVYPVYLSIKHPLIHQYEEMVDPFLARTAKEKGHDGILIVRSDGSIEEVVVFRPDQIKHATKNKGTFSGDSIYASLCLAGNPNHDEHGRFASGSSTWTRPDETPEEIAARNAKAQAHAAASDKMIGKLKNGMAGFVVGGLPKEKQQLYLKAASQVLDYMPIKAIETLHENVDSVGFYESTARLTRVLHPNWANDPTKKGKLLGGAFEHELGSPRGRLHLDGGGDMGDTYPDTTRNIYAHEFAHAVDCKKGGDPTYSENGTSYPVGGRISDSWKWLGAYADEINLDTEPLSRYATHNAAEGFAEFGRLCWTQPRYARESFPKCWNIFHDHGLVEGKRAEV